MTPTQGEQQVSLIKWSTQTRVKNEPDRYPQPFVARIVLSYYPPITRVLIVTRAKTFDSPGARES